MLRCFARNEVATGRFGFMRRPRTPATWTDSNSRMPCEVPSTARNFYCTTSRSSIDSNAPLRWERPEFGIVGPDTFIPLCEEIGLIVPLGRWVMRRACEQLAAWLQRGLPSVRLAMNISARQMLDPHLVGDLRGALAETGISPGTVELEITESVLMADVTGVRRVIGELKHLGVRISLDDFGTGYSGLSYLKNFSVDALKIDRTFVRDLPADRGDAAIVSSVVALGHAMGLRVVAEGVETAEQAGLVRRLGCDELQGFYFSKPMTIEALERTVRAWAL